MSIKWFSCYLRKWEPIFTPAAEVYAEIFEEKLMLGWSTSGQAIFNIRSDSGISCWPFRYRFKMGEPSYQLLCKMETGKEEMRLIYWEIYNRKFTFQDFKLDTFVSWIIGSICNNPLKDGVLVLYWYWMF